MKTPTAPNDLPQNPPAPKAAAQSSAEFRMPDRRHPLKSLVGTSALAWLILLTALTSVEPAHGADPVPVITVESMPAIEWTSLPARPPGSFVFRRDPVGTKPLRVKYAVTGTATRRFDYSLRGSTVTFKANSATATKTFRVRDDNLVEEFETVVVTLVGGAGYSLGTESSATAAITDDDVNVTVEATDPIASEPGGPEGTATFTFTRAAPSLLYPLSKSLTVPFSVVGTADRRRDYIKLPRSVTFAPGSLTTNVTLTPTADLRNEGPETVYIALRPRTGYSLGIPFSATATILNAEPIAPLLVDTRFTGGVVSLEFNQPMRSGFSFGWNADEMIPSSNFRNHRWSTDKRVFMFDASLPAQISITFILNPTSHPDGFRSALGVWLSLDTPSEEIQN